MSVTKPPSSNSMPNDDSQVFQNMILSVSRMESKISQAQGDALRNSAFGRWTIWELARNTDRIWREWWDDAPSTPSEPSSSITMLEQTSESDSGFCENLYSDFEEPSTSPRAHSKKTCIKSLDIGKTIHRATMELSCCMDVEPVAHEYRWGSIHLDVFRVLLSYEQRTQSQGMSAIISTAVMR